MYTYGIKIIRRETSFVMIINVCAKTIPEKYTYMFRTFIMQ